MKFRLKNCSPGDFCMGLTLKFMQAIRVSKCCFFFNLRQGTIMVAIVELALTSITLFLLLLAAMNMQEITSIASAELKALEDSLATEFGDKVGLPFYYSNNEKKMLTGQHLATIMMTVSYAGVVLSVIHILSCLMLLYGAIYNNSNFLLPWLSTVLLSIVISLLLLLSFVFCSFVFFQQHKCILSFYITAAMVLEVEIYAWLVVFSYYREISCKKSIYSNIESIVQTEGIRGDMKYTRAI